MQGYIRIKGHRRVEDLGGEESRVIQASESRVEVSLGEHLGDKA